VQLQSKHAQDCFYEVLAIQMFISILITTLIAPSFLATTVKVANTGKILTEKTLITYKSEIRGVFIFEGIFGYSHDWNVIAQTLAEYGINAVFVNDFSTFGRRPDSEIRAAIDAFHAYGIEYHSVMAVLQDTKANPSVGTEAITYDGQIYADGWSHCPIKAHDYVLDAIRNYLNDFPDVDGIMLDFIRYHEGTTGICFCNYCRAEFQEWLGENITDWTPFYPDQPRHNEWLEWRNIPVTRLVRDIHDTIKSINPNIVISEAAWSLFSDCPIYWRKFLGQDTAKWIAEGYIDFVAPMMYTKDLADLEGMIDTNIKYWLGGQPEGKIPLVAFLRNDYTQSDDPTPEQFKALVDLVRSKGLDGWIIWRYGGPGSDAPYPDIREYLSIIDMPQTFTLTNINVETSTNSATITWYTTLPSTSKVEYSTTPLFNSSWKIWGGFHYWNITYALGTIVDNGTNVLYHSITINDLASGTKYYFRVQSKNEYGTVTSKVLTFTTKTST